MIYETKRLIIRKARREDSHFIYEMLQDPVILKYNCISSPTEDEVITYIEKTKNDIIHYVIEHKETHQVIGEINFEPDSLRYGVDSIQLSYHLDTDYVGKGYMKEALNGALAYGFNHLHVKMFTARVFTENERSNNLLLHLGFKLEGTLRHAVKAYQDIIYDDNLYSITVEEYVNHN
jgi:ribosomal-protein-alanine N-acetyltransferase